MSNFHYTLKLTDTNKNYNIWIENDYFLAKNELYQIRENAKGILIQSGKKAFAYMHYKEINFSAKIPNHDIEVKSLEKLSITTTSLLTNNKL